MQRNFGPIFELPYFNELTANQLGSTTTFNSTTPLQYTIDSINRINQFMQSGGGQLPITQPRPGGKTPSDLGLPDWNIEICKTPEGYPTRCSSPSAQPDYGIYGQTPPIGTPLPPSTGQGQNKQDLPCGTPGTENLERCKPIPFSLSGFFAKEENIGFGLIVLAILLGIIGIISFK